MHPPPHLAPLHSCLREDVSGCYPDGHKYHDITHNGLDAMLTRYMVGGQGP